MKIIIEADPKEIAKLAKDLQSEFCTFKFISGDDDRPHTLTMDEIPGPFVDPGIVRHEVSRRVEGMSFQDADQ